MNWLLQALRFWPWLAAISSGLLYRFCFAPIDLPGFCWVALVPLLCAVWFSGAELRRKWLRDLSLGYVAGVTFFWSVFSWLTTVTTIGWILVGAYLGLYIAIWAWLAGQLRPRVRAFSPRAGLEAVTRRLEAKRVAERSGDTPVASEPPTEVSALQSPWLSSYRNLRVAFVLAAAWVAAETVRSTLFTGWGWNTLGTALHGQWALIQIVDLTGVPGLSFLVAFGNIVLVAVTRRFIDEARAKVRRPHFELTLTMATIVGIAGYGVRAVQERPLTTTTRVAALQPNIPRDEKFNFQAAEKTFGIFTRLSNEGLQSKPDLLLWPESSMPGPVMHHEQSYRFVMDYAAAAKVDLLLGAIDQDETTAYNAALLVSKGGEQVQLYRKIHLVPFGEYVPGRHTLPGIARIVGDQVPEDFGRGIEPSVFIPTKEEVRIAPLICFEDTVAELTRRFVLPWKNPETGEVRPGANLLANVTNDGWFKETSGSQQHLQNAVFRCVETRLPMVRSANTGITCVINQYGRVTHQLPRFREGVLTGEARVPTEYEPTFYVRHGDWVAQICLAVTAATLAYLLLRLRRSLQSS